jgi:short-subunit dehydrogenase
MWRNCVIACIIAVVSHLMYDFVTRVPPIPMKGKTILVTGASQGIGAALAKEFARNGAGDIIMAARSVDKMELVRAEIFADGLADPSLTRIHILKADLSTREASEACIKDSLDILGDKGLDILVLNHITNSRFGTWLQDNRALPGGHDFVPTMFETNTFSYMYMTTAAIDSLHTNSGQIVVISSLAGWIGPPKCAVYSATKHALHGFFDSLRVELKMAGMDNIGITIASLGAHATEGAAEVQKHVKSMVKWEPAAQAARAVVEGASARKREVFTPVLAVYPLLALRPFFPSLCDFLLRIAMVPLADT